MEKPTAYYPWSQGRQKRGVGQGVCYGLCVRLAKKVKTSSNYSDCFERLHKELKNRGTATLNSAISQQKYQLQSSRPRVEPPLPKKTPLIICCNTQSTPGWFTRYNILSYLNIYAWFGDHACLMWHDDGGTTIFDPNFGLACWKDKTNPTSADIQDMLDWGYIKELKIDRSIWVWGFQKVYKD